MSESFTELWIPYNKTEDNEFIDPGMAVFSEPDEILQGGWEWRKYELVEPPKERP